MAKPYKINTNLSLTFWQGLFNVANKVQGKIMNCYF
jgi:hypothetical protein